MSDLNIKKNLFLNFGLGAFSKANEILKTVNYLPHKPARFIKLLKLAYTQPKQGLLSVELLKDKDFADSLLSKTSISQEEGTNAYEALNNLDYNLIESLIETEFARKYHNAIFNKLSEENQKIWLQNIRAAVIAKAVSDWKNYESPELAFVAALLHDLPLMVLQINDAESYEEFQYKKHHGMQETEAALVCFGIDMSELGAKLFKNEKMPESLIDVTRYGYRVNEVKEKNQTLVQIVTLARFLGECFNDKTQSPSSIWNEAQSVINDLNLEVSKEDWANKISLVFVKSLEFELRVKS